MPSLTSTPVLVKILSLKSTTSETSTPSENSTPFAYNFAALIKEFFASPLVTGAAATGTYPSANAVPVSISRRDHFCAALSNRLGKPDLCAQAVPRPSSSQTATATEDVRRDIVQQLQLASPAIFVTGFDRPNLIYESRNIAKSKEKAAELVQLLRDETSIVKLTAGAVSGIRIRLPFGHDQNGVRIGRIHLLFEF